MTNKVMLFNLPFKNKRNVEMSGEDGIRIEEVTELLSPESFREMKGTDIPLAGRGRGNAKCIHVDIDNENEIIQIYLLVPEQAAEISIRLENTRPYPIFSIDGEEITDEVP